MEPACAPPAHSPLHSLVSELAEDLRWVAFLFAGRPPKIIQQPATDDDVRPLVEKISQMTSDLCQAGRGTLMLVHEGETYVIFCENLQPWMVLNIAPDLPPEIIRPIIERCVGVESNIPQTALPLNRKAVQKHAIG